MQDPLADLRLAAEALDPTALSDPGLAERVVELRRVIDGLEGVWSRLIATLDGSGSIDGGTASWLRSACRLSPSAARSRVVLARRLVERPAVAAALTGGEISVDHARLVTTALSELDASAGGALAASTEAPMLAAARRCDPARLRREIAHARHALVPEAAANADQEAYERRHLDVSTTFGGAVVVTGVLDPEGGEALLTALAPLTAPAGPDDTRSPGQRRADALVDLCHRGLASAGFPEIGGERPHLTVVVPLAALAPPADPPASVALTTTPPATTAAPSRILDTGPAGIDNATPGARVAAPPTIGGMAAEGLWGAVLGPRTVRRLACDASVTRVVLGPDSQPLDVGRRTRTIPPAIRTALVVRDRGCVFPGCDRPPPWTDAHHVRHWADGGDTTVDNLVLLCRTHHRTVHERRWRLARDPTGHWTAHPPDQAAPPASRAA